MATIIRISWTEKITNLEVLMRVVESMGVGTEWAGWVCATLNIIWVGIAYSGFSFVVNSLIDNCPPWILCKTVLLCCVYR